MNAIGGVLDADQELDYVLEVPVDHATTLQDKLMLTGVPERCIRVARPSRRVQVSQSDTGLEPNDYQPSRAKPFTRFLPGAIKLGTYADGLYNVTIRRRPFPEGRESVCISLSSTSAADEAAEGEVVTAENTVTPGQDDQLQTANQSRRVMGCGGGGGGGFANGEDGEPVTIPTCNCDDTECENYRMRVCEYFANSGTNYTSVCAATDCVHKQIVDALKLTESSSADHIATADTVETCTNESVGSDVPARPRTADPVKSDKVEENPKPVTPPVPADDTAVKKKKKFGSKKKKTEDSRKDDGHSCPTCPTCPKCSSSPTCPKCPKCPSSPSCPKCPSTPSCPKCPSGPSCPKCPKCEANVNTVRDCKTGHTDSKNFDESLKTAKLNPRT